MPEDSGAGAGGVAIPGADGDTGIDPFDDEQPESNTIIRITVTDVNVMYSFFIFHLFIRFTFICCAEIIAHCSYLIYV